jgi:hypothetical protein
VLLGWIVVGLSSHWAGITCDGAALTVPHPGPMQCNMLRALASLCSSGTFCGWFDTGAEESQHLCTRNATAT